MTAAAPRIATRRQPALDCVGVVADSPARLRGSRGLGLVCDGFRRFGQIGAWCGFRSVGFRLRRLDVSGLCLRERRLRNLRLHSLLCFFFRLFDRGLDRIRIGRPRGDVERASASGDLRPTVLRGGRSAGTTFGWHYALLLRGMSVCRFDELLATGITTLGCRCGSTGGRCLGPRTGCGRCVRSRRGAVGGRQGAGAEIEPRADRISRLSLPDPVDLDHAQPHAELILDELVAWVVVTRTTTSAVAVRSSVLSSVSAD